MTACTNEQGVFSSKLKLESSAERLIAITNYISLPPFITVDVGSSNNAKLSFGTENTVRGGIV